MHAVPACSTRMQYMYACTCSVHARSCRRRRCAWRPHWGGSAVSEQAGAPCGRVVSYRSEQAALRPCLRTHPCAARARRAPPGCRCMRSLPRHHQPHDGLASHEAAPAGGRAPQPCAAHQGCPPFMPPGTHRRETEGPSRPMHRGERGSGSESVLCWRTARCAPLRRRATARIATSLWWGRGQRGRGRQRAAPGGCRRGRQGGPSVMQGEAWMVVRGSARLPCRRLQELGGMRRRTQGRRLQGTRQAIQTRQAGAAWWTMRIPHATATSLRSRRRQCDAWSQVGRCVPARPGWLTRPTQSSGTGHHQWSLSTKWRDLRLLIAGSPPPGRSAAESTARRSACRPAT